MKFLDENLLEYLQRPEFSELYDSMARQNVPKGSMLCQPGLGDNCVFIVAEGRARVYLAYEDKEFNLGILTPGDIYSTHTRAFVQALDEIEFLTVDISVFARKMLNHPKVTQAMVGVLGNMLKNSFTIIEDLVFKDVNTRLKGLFASEAVKHGEPSDNGGMIVKIDLSVEQIAQLVGSTRQTVSTLLNNLARQELVIKLNRGNYLIPDPDALQSCEQTLPP